MNKYNLLSLEEIKGILEKSKTIAVVGLSSNPARASHRVSEYLKEENYTIYPVNPNETEVLGEKTYPDLKSLPILPDIVDVFRKSEEVMPIVDDCIALGVKMIWFQLGVINEAAIIKAINNGIKVVVDKCIMVEHMNLV